MVRTARRADGDPGNNGRKVTDTGTKGTPPERRALALHKQHAVVHTASIDVHIMRLDKRQVTMSVFRQLDEESVFLTDGTLRGTVWGRVNYLWKDNPKGTAFHVVWQDGDRLKRCAVPDLIDVGYDRWWQWCHDGDKAPPRAWRYRRGSAYVPANDKEAKWCREHAGDIKYRGERYSHPTFHYCPQGVAQALADELARLGWECKIGPASKFEGAVEYLAFGTRCDEYGAFKVSETEETTAALDHLASFLRDVGDRYEARDWDAYERFDQRVEEMMQLDQLFIAV